MFRLFWGRLFPLDSYDGDFMRTWLANLWRALSSGFWLVPGAFLLGGLALALLIPVIDRQWGDVLPGGMHTTPTTARATLTALSSAMLTITGVVFSTTIVALSITSTHLGPRLLRNFLRQMVTQVTLGVCLAGSVYCLVLLRQIDERDGAVFVPQLSLLVASMLGLLTLVMIVYFIHRVAHSMQAQNVVSDVADDLDASVRRMFPNPISANRRAPSDDEDDADDPLSDDVWRREWEGFEQAERDTVVAAADGYLQAIEDETPLRVASQRGVRVRVLVRAGDYVRAGQTLLETTPAGRLREADERRLRRSFLLGNQRTTQQDVECAINEIVEIAVRALSPGVNDPFTAVTCVDRLSGALRRLAGREMPSGLRHAADGTVRVVHPARRFGSIVDAAFNQIRQYSVGCVPVTARLLESIHAIGEATERRVVRAALHRQAEMIVESARDAGLAQYDLADIEERRHRARAVLEPQGPDLLAARVNGAAAQLPPSRAT